VRPGLSIGRVGVRIRSGQPPLEVPAVRPGTGIPIHGNCTRARKPPEMAMVKFYLWLQTIHFIYGWHDNI